MRTAICLFVSLAIIQPSGALSQDDPIAVNLTVAVEAYAKSLSVAHDAVIADIRKRKAAAQGSGDLKTIERLDAEESRFVVEGIPPLSANWKQFEIEKRRAATKMHEAYSVAIKAYTTSGQLDKAKLIQKELDDFLSEKPKPLEARSFWVHSEGYFLRGAGSDWFERWANGHNLFSEVQRTEEFIELKQDSAPRSVRIYADRLLLKEVRQREFQPIYQGSWKAFQPGSKPAP